MFSKTCEYGIRATLFIAKQALKSDKKINVKDIAKGIDSPVAFTAKILQILTHADIVSSLKGPYGGFYIPKDKLNNIILKDIVFAIEGESIYKGCGLGLSECSDEKPCPVHHKFKEIKDKLNDMLYSTSLLELADGLDSGITFLKR